MAKDKDEIIALLEAMANDLKQIQEDWGMSRTVTDINMRSNLRRLEKLTRLTIVNIKMGDSGND